MDRIIQGYWACPACGTYDVSGLVDACPSCGRRKDPNTKHYLPGHRPAGIGKSGESQPKKVYVTEKQLRDAGIAPEECDGNHKEWVCPYCDTLNNWADEYCASCGAPKSSSKQNYGDHDKVRMRTWIGVPLGEPRGCHVEKEQKNSQVERQSAPLRRTAQPVVEEEPDLTFLISFGMVAAIVGALIFLFAPIKEVATVTDFSWSRSVAIEEFQTVRESGWSVPSGGRTYDTREEIRNYTQVLDHYETVTKEKSRQVLDHYETYYTYSDNGNGTFTEHEHSSPVYKTEYYTETEEKPVYKQVPVYDTKYYYEIDKWVTVDYAKSEGTDRSPYWETYRLSGEQREGNRYEEYTIYYDNGKHANVSKDVWDNTSVGDQVVITKNRLGMVYSQEGVIEQENIKNTETKREPFTAPFYYSKKMKL